MSLCRLLTFFQESLKQVFQESGIKKAKIKFSTKEINI